MTKFKLVLPSLATALPLSAALIFSGCATETVYPLSAYTNHPVGDAIAQYLSEQDALTFPDEGMEDALSQFGVEVVSEETLRERLGDEAEAVLGEHCTYLYTEREFTTQYGDTLLSPAVYVISADEDRWFTQTFTPENSDGARWDSYYVSVHDILSWQYLPAEDGGYDCIALSDFAFVRVYCTEHYIFPAGHTGSTQSEYLYTQYAPYFDDAVTPMQQNVGIQEDMRLEETTIIISGVEIGSVSLSRGRE